MRTLGEARSELTARLGELSTDFWTEGNRNDAVNDAQRFVASITRGVPTQVTGMVSAGVRYLSVPHAIAGAYATSGVVGEKSVTVVPISVADAVAPAWRNMVGQPRWVVVDTTESRVWVSPAPTIPTNAVLVVAVVPPDLLTDSDPLFLGNSSMDKYLGVVTNYAAAMCLLRERFDGDAERFYQLAVQELGALGADPSVIPPLAPPRE